MTADIVVDKHGWVHGRTKAGTEWLRCNVVKAARMWDSNVDILPADRRTRGKRSWAFYDPIPAIAGVVVADVVNGARADGLVVDTEATT